MRLTAVALDIKAAPATYTQHEAGAESILPTFGACFLF